MRLIEVTTSIPRDVKRAYLRLQQGLIERGYKPTVPLTYDADQLQTYIAEFFHARRGQLIVDIGVNGEMYTSDALGVSYNFDVDALLTKFDKKWNP